MAQGAVIQPPGTLPLGIDVSHHNGVVDWRGVAAAGMVFAYAKATEGATFTDHQFQTNWAAMRAAGLARGAYHFFRPAAPVGPQADSFLAAVGTLGPGDLPPMLDLEETPGGVDEWAGLPQGGRVAAALEWLERVEQALGRKAIVYTRRGFIGEKLGAPGALTTYPLWIAHYTAAAKPAMPAGWARWSLWQYTETGSVAGITGNVDVNRFNGTAQDLVTLTGCQP